MEEIFKAIDLTLYGGEEDYTGLYEISNLGVVRSVRPGKERVISHKINSDKYHYVNLYKNGSKKEIFINTLIKYFFDVQEKEKISKLGNWLKLKKEDILFIRENKDKYNKCELARMFNVSRQYIYNILKSKVWRLAV